MEIFARGLGMLEGPVHCRDGSFVATALDHGRVYRIAADGSATILAETGGGANGATEGPDGSIYVAQNGGFGPAFNHVRAAPGVQRIAPNGSITTFGADMVSPNDLCFGPDGLLYVTDPTRKPERDDGRIWRCDVTTMRCEPIFRCDWYPNGIGFDADDRLYVADSRLARIVRFPLDDVRPEAMEVAVTLDHGLPDGFAFDAAGDLVIAAPDFGAEGGDVQVYRDGRLVRCLNPGTSQLYTNLAISPDARIFLCDADKGDILVDDWPCPGLPLHPFRPQP